jgi:hypothetical protein
MGTYLSRNAARCYNKARLSITSGASRPGSRRRTREGSILAFSFTARSGY